MDANGKLKSFGGNYEPTIGQSLMCIPIHLTIDLNGFVMIVERQNRQVLSLDSDLELMREILSEERHDLRDPREDSSG